MPPTARNLLLFSLLLPCMHASQCVVTAPDGHDTPTCGPAAAPCATLAYAVRSRHAACVYVRGVNYMAAPVYVDRALVVAGYPPDVGVGLPAVLSGGREVPAAAWTPVAPGLWQTVLANASDVCQPKDNVVKRRRRIR